VRSPLVTLLALAMPMVLARATQSVITFADAIQVEHLGAGALAATATGGINVVGVVILPMGTVFIIQSFVSQLVGRGERAHTPRFALYGLLVALLAAIVAVALIPAIGPMLSLTSYSPGVQAAMTDYMAIRFLSVGAVIGVEALGAWYGGLGNTWMQMIAGFVTMASAVFFNWVLIDGHLGAPALGVAGAAWSAVIASWLGFATVFVAYWRRLGGVPRERHGALSLAEMRRVFRFGLPSGMNWFLEFAAFQVFINFVMSSLGDETVAALNAVLAVNSLGFMPAFGLASAGAIVAGQAIGAGKRDAVWPTVKMTLAVAMTWMGLLGILYVTIPSHIVTLFDSQGRSQALVSIGTTMLMLSTGWQLFDAISLTLSETLRAAGDTFWTATVRMVLAWVVFTPIAVFVVMHLGGGPEGAMLCLIGYLALLAVAFAYRFRSGVWKSIELIEPTLD
jgi:multidrug resistance protein, MATE family